MRLDVEAGDLGGRELVRLALGWIGTCRAIHFDGLRRIIQLGVPHQGPASLDLGELVGRRVTALAGVTAAPGDDEQAATRKATTATA